MTSKEYIRLTNLEKTRIALRILRDLSDCKEIPQKEKLEVEGKLMDWRVRLERNITTNDKHGK